MLNRKQTELIYLVRLLRPLVGAMVLALNVSVYFCKSLPLHMNGNLPVGIGMHVFAMICDLIHVSGVLVCALFAKRGGLSSLGTASPCTLLLAKCFCLTRLETRTKESNRCASSWVGKPFCAMKVLAGIFAPAADRLADRGLSLSTSIRTRKMVNYA